MDQVQNPNQTSTPANGGGKPAPKHMRSFWPIMIIFVLAVVVGGIIVWTAFNNANQDEINSIFPTFHRRNKDKATSTPPEVKGVMTSKTGGQMQK